MTNQFRSSAFIKIKQTIQKTTTALHLPACRVMIENADVVCSKDEITILKEYLQSAWDRINPVAMRFEDEMETRIHDRTCGGHSPY